MAKQPINDPVKLAWRKVEQAERDYKKANDDYEEYRRVIETKSHQLSYQQLVVALAKAIVAKDKALQTYNALRLAKQQNLDLELGSD